MTSSPRLRVRCTGDISGSEAQKAQWEREDAAGTRTVDSLASAGRGEYVLAPNRFVRGRHARIRDLLLSRGGDRRLLAAPAASRRGKAFFAGECRIEVARSFNPLILVRSHLPSGNQNPCPFETERLCSWLATL